MVVKHKFQRKCGNSSMVFPRTTELLDRHFIGGFTWTPIVGFGSGWWGRTTFTWVKAMYTNRCANPLYPDGQFWVMPSTILERRATTWTLAASCNGLVWMVRLELTASASQMRRSANWTTSRFGGWVIYPLTSHSSCIIITRNIRTGILTSCIVP